MKKFAFLLAIVAVFAMSASAFAANELTAIGTGKTADINNGAVVVANTEAPASASTDVYYVGELSDADDFAIGVSLDYAAHAADSDTVNAMVGTATFASGTAKAVTGVTFSGTTAGVADSAKITLDAALTKSTDLTIGIVADSGSDWANKASGLATLTVNPVKVSLVKSLDVYKTVSNDEQTVSLALASGALIVPGDGKLELKDAAPKGVNVKIDYDKTSKLTTIVVSTDANAITKNETLVFKTLASGSFAATDVVISDDARSDVKIAKLAEDIDLVSVVLVAKDIPAQDLAAAISKDVNVVKNALNIVGPDNKVISKDVAITIVSGDAVKQQVTVISLDKDGNAVALGAPYSDVRINVAEGYAHSATESAASKDLALDATGYELKIGTGDIETMIRSLSTGRGADDTETKPYHLDVLGSVYKLDYQYSRQAVDTSSGGACDMGLGLAAAALAIVALRKRSK